MKAYLVDVCFRLRVVVPADSDSETIINAAKKRFVRLDALDDFHDNVTEIEDDYECPYGTFDQDINEPDIAG